MLIGVRVGSCECFGITRALQPCAGVGTRGSPALPLWGVLPGQGVSLWL